MMLVVWLDGLVWWCIHHPPTCIYVHQSAGSKYRHFLSLLISVSVMYILLSNIRARLDPDWTFAFLELFLESIHPCPPPAFYGVNFTP